VPSCLFPSSTPQPTKLGQIEAQRGVRDDIAALRRVAQTTPQISMHVQDLISLLDPAVLATIKAIPVAYGSFIDVAIGTVAIIYRDFVCAMRVVN
jgi:hypothetical protein